MRVLHVAKFPPGTPGGIERYVDELATAQRRMGMEVAVLACTDSRSRTPPPPRGYPVYLARSLGQALYVPIAPSFPLALRRALREFRPDVLHIQWPNPLALVALASPAARHLKWIVQWQADIAVEGGPRAVSLLYRAGAWLERRLLARASKVLASSVAYAACSPALRQVRERVEVVPLGICLQPSVAEANRESVAWPRPDELRVLGIARLVGYKGLDVLIEALRRSPGVSAAVIGSGPDAARLRDAGADLVEAGRLLFLGQLSDASLAAWLASCDVLVLPSVNRLEAFGMTLLEAARAGKPAIATRVEGSGMAEVIEALGAGYLAEPGSAESLAGALRQALHDRSENRLEGPHAARLARFDIDASARVIAACYEAG